MTAITTSAYQTYQHFDFCLTLGRITWVINKSHHWCSMGTGKSQPKSPTCQLETRLAEFPTWAVDPRVGIFLSSLNISDQFFFSHVIKYNSFSHMPSSKQCIYSRCWCRLMHGYVRYKNFYSGVKSRIARLVQKISKKCHNHKTQPTNDT